MCLLISGLIISIIGLIILFSGISTHSSNQKMITEIDRSVINCNDKKSFDKLRDGDLVFISGEYDTKNNGAYDRDFEMNFKEPIIKRTVERYQSSRYGRLLKGINEDNDNNTQIEKEKKITNPKTKRCKK